jgi:hypothetical protein
MYIWHCTVSNTGKGSVMIQGAKPRRDMIGWQGRLSQLTLNGQETCAVMVIPEIWEMGGGQVGKRGEEQGSGFERQ